MLIDHLKQTFAERCRRNPSYSLRAFARSLGMDSSTVSAILKGKRPITLKTAQKIIKGLNINDPTEARGLIVDTFAATEVSAAENYTELAMQAAEAISAWEHFAILAVLELNEPKMSQRFISERLNIPLGIVMECLGRLEKLGLVRKTRTGWETSGKNFKTPSEIPNSALREGLRQNIQKALHSLDNDPVDVRDMTGITMAISKSRLHEAKKQIHEFRRRLTSYLEGGRKDSVYRLNIQLFPFSQERK